MRVAGYLASKYPKDSLVNFSITSIRNGADEFYMQMRRADAEVLLGTPLGYYLDLETTLVVPLRGAAVGNDATIVQSTAK